MPAVIHVYTCTCAVHVIFFPEIQMLALCYLDISCNHITALPTTLRHIVDTLKIFKMDDNPIESPPTHVCTCTCTCVLHVYVQPLTHRPTPVRVGTESTCHVLFAWVIVGYWVAGLPFSPIYTALASVLYIHISTVTCACT